MHFFTMNLNTESAKEFNDILNEKINEAEASFLDWFKRG